jgi:DNA polymerase I-like protein with 3'-5' exonuclease and polymerase domains
MVENSQNGKRWTLPTTNIVFLDIETDGLQPTVIHCVVTKRPNEDHLIHTCSESLWEELSGAGCVCGHNYIGYDGPALKKLWGVEIHPDRVLDTLVMSRLFYPDIQGGHSLDQWGTRLGCAKGSHDDWTKLTTEMIKYCMQDVTVTELLYSKLNEQLQAFGFSDTSVWLEHSVAHICHEQEQNGFMFNKTGGELLARKLDTKMSGIEAKLQTVFPPVPEEQRYHKTTGKPLPLKYQHFNVGSRQQIAERLKQKGAVWKEKTPSGKDKVDESTLKKNLHIPEAKMVLEFLLLQKRYAQVISWNKAVEGGRIHGRIKHIGAVTGRMAHSSPNLAQVPAVTAEYGTECRSLFCVPDNRVLVGADASGLELRMLAHYMDDDDYTKEILEGDIHTANQLAAGLETRPQAKTFIYAFLYGAGNAKIGAIVGGSAMKGGELKDKFLENTPALADLRERITTQGEEGFLDGLDGRRLRVRSAHAALNTLLQGAGAVVMKQAVIHLYELLDGIDFKLVAQVHDEWQIECRPEDAEHVGKCAVQAIIQAGETFNLNCPLDGEYRIGNNWAETH